MKKQLLFGLTAMLFTIVGCDESAEYHADGGVYGSVLSRSYGNLYTGIPAFTTGYVEVVVEGAIGENSTGENSSITIPLRYIDVDNYQGCAFTNADGTSDGDAIAAENIAGDTSNGDGTLDVFPIASTGSKRLGCEITSDGITETLKVYVDGVEKGSATLTQTMAGPPGFGYLKDFESGLVIKSFAVYDKRPQ